MAWLTRLIEGTPEASIIELKILMCHIVELLLGVQLLHRLPRRVSLSFAGRLTSTNLIIMHTPLHNYGTTR